MKTFIDGGTDTFVYNGVLSDHQRIVPLRNSSESLQRDNVRYVLYPPRTAFTDLLDQGGRWRVRYAGAVARWYARALDAGAND